MLISHLANVENKLLSEYKVSGIAGHSTNKGNPREIYLKKSTIKSFQTGYVPPSILNYVITYDGPKNMKTVHNWLTEIYQEIGINCPDLPSDSNSRISKNSPSLEGVFILGKGFIYFDNIQT